MREYTRLLDPTRPSAITLSCTSETLKTGNLRIYTF